MEKIKYLKYLDQMDFIPSGQYSVLEGFMLFKGEVIDISLSTFRLISGNNIELFNALCEFADM